VWKATFALARGYEFDGAQNELEPSEYVTDRYRKQSPQLFGQLGFAP
jgi:hypothetical protein